MPRARIYPPSHDVPPETGGILALIQPDPLVWLYAIDIPSTPRSKLRLSANPEPLNFERDSTGAVVTYLPGSIIHEDVQSDTEGSIQKTKLQFQNITRESIALLETYNGLIGEKVRVVCVRLGNLPDGAPEIDETYDIIDSSATESVVELQIGRVALTQKKFPDRRISRLSCAHDYGGLGCGYDTTRSGALQTCTKLLGVKLRNDNGCYHHGEDEAAATLTNRHPARMLFFPGIPRRSGTGVTP